MTPVVGVLALTLLAWAAFVGALRLHFPVGDSLRAAVVESALVGLTVGGVAVVAAQVYLVPDHPFLASDFGQYCSAVEGVRVRDSSLIPPQRGLAGALLPGLLARSVGLVDGLFVSAVISQCVAGIGLALWARAAFGPGSGALASVTALGFAPFVILSRLLTFAASTLALAWLAMGLAMCAYRFRSGATAIATLWVSAMVLWMDVRGVLWSALPVVVTLFLAVRLNGHSRWGIPVMGLVAASVSWWAAGEIVHPGAPGFETQSLRMLEEQAQLAGASGWDWPALLDYSLEHEFLWGHRANLLGTFQRLAALRLEIPAYTDPRYGMYVGPWGPIALVSLGAAFAVACARRQLESVVGLVLVLPALMVLHSSSSGIAHPRYLAMAAPAVVGGITALSGLLGDWLVERVPSREGRVRRQPAAGVSRLLVQVCVASFGLFLLGGGLPTPLAWRASWRSPIMPDTEPVHTLQVVAGLSEPLENDVQACFDGLRRDREQGLPNGSRLMGWSVERE